jgi:hypothetical protein
LLGERGLKVEVEFVVGVREGMGLKLAEVHVAKVIDVLPHKPHPQKARVRHPRKPALLC